MRAAHKHRGTPNMRYCMLALHDNWRSIAVRVPELGRGATQGAHTMADSDTDNDEAKRKDRWVEKGPEAGNLSDMLQELRVLLQGAQVLTGFLIILPFYQGFPSLSSTQHTVYLATFGCALASLIIFSAPAAQ